MPKLDFITCGYLKFSSVNTRLYDVFTEPAAGLFALISDLNANRGSFKVAPELLY
jgi:hypothetical protein